MPEELDFLAPADRFLIEISKIYRLKPRLKAMIYRAKFLENIEQLEEEAQRIYEASKALLDAPHFSELLKVSQAFNASLFRFSTSKHSLTRARRFRLQLILMLGNFLNAAGHKGNAQGFKVTSINKLVDTKSSQSSNRTLLHFTAKTVSQTMPDTECFLDELSKPADAFKGKRRNKRENVLVSRGRAELTRVTCERSRSRARPSITGRFPLATDFARNALARAL